MLTNEYKLEVTLLYPPDESIPDPLPQVAGLTPKGSLVVVDVSMDGLPLDIPPDTLKKAQTIRFEGERETIYYSEFMKLPNLKELPPSMPHLRSIQVDAFRGCSNLTTLGDMKSLHTIKENAFFNCTKLDKFHIPETMEHVMENAFKGCPLGEVTVASANFQFQCYDDTLRGKLRGRDGVYIFANLVTVSKQKNTVVV